MGAVNASQLSFSSFKPVSNAGKQLKQLADQLLTQKVDNKIQKALQDAVMELDHSLTQGSSMSSMFSAADKVIHMIDVIGAIDAEFVLDQLEELNYSKRSKKAELSTYLLDKSQQIDVAGSAAAASATLSSTAISGTSSSSSSQSSTDSSDEELIDYIDPHDPRVQSGELGAIAALSQQHHENFGHPRGDGEPLQGTPYGPIDMIDSNALQNNELGAIAGLGQQMMENRALTAGAGAGGGMPGLMDGKLTIGGHMMAFIKDFTPEELMEQLMGILESGIDDVSDLTKLMKILGELGANVPQHLLDKIKEVIGEFLAEAMSTTGSMTEFLVLLQQLQSMAGEFGSDVLAEIGDGSQLVALFGESNMTDGDKTMAEGMGLVIEEDSSGGDSFNSTAEPLNEEMQLMQELDEFASDLIGISVEGSVAQAVAGSQNIVPNKAVNSTQRIGLEDTTNKVGAVSKSGIASNTLGNEAISPIEEVVKASLEFLYSNREEFGDQVREFVESYLENDLLDRLDVLKT